MRQTSLLAARFCGVIGVLYPIAGHNPRSLCSLDHLDAGIGAFEAAEGQGISRGGSLFGWWMKIR
jgi:hypothetical protein